MNIVVNAVEATLLEEQIRSSHPHAIATAACRFTDTGPGIPEVGSQIRSSSYTSRQSGADRGLDWL